VVLRAAAQKVDSQANSPFRPGHRAAVCTVCLGRLAALGASAGPDVVLRRSAVRFPESSQELVRGFPSVTAEQVRLAVYQGPQLLVVSKMVEFLPEIQVAAQKGRPAAVHQTQPLAVPLVKLAESVWPLVVSLEALVQPVLQPMGRQPAMRQES
jgi:hypothetical protein